MPKEKWTVGEPCLCERFGRGKGDIFQCGPDGHLPIPPNSPVFYACRGTCRRLYDAEGNVIGHRAGLAQRYIGAIEIGDDYTRKLSFCWYGGAEIIAWNSDGSFAEKIPFVEWSLDAAELNAKARKAIQALDTDPAAWPRRHAEILAEFNRQKAKECGGEDAAPAQVQPNVLPAFQIPPAAIMPRQIES